MKIKITLLSLALVTVSVFIATLTKDAVSPDLRDALNNEEFTNITPFQKDSKSDVPVPAASEASEPAKAPETDEYGFCYQARINLDTPHIGSDSRKLKREIFGIFKEAGIEYSYDKEREGIYNCYSITYKPKGELRIRTLPYEITCQLDIENDTPEFTSEMKKAEIRILPYPESPIKYLGTREIMVLQGFFSEEELEGKIKELDAQAVYVNKKESKGAVQSTVFYVPK